MSDINGIKVEPKLEVAVEANKTKNINKTKNGDIEDNSTSQNAQKIVNNVIVATPEMLSDILGIAQESIGSKANKVLLTKPVEAVRKGFKEVPPLFFASNASERNIEEQVDLLISPSVDESFKRQGIATLGFLTRRDLELLKLIKEIDGISNYSILLMSMNINPSSAVSTKEAYERIYIRIEAKISKYTKKYGQATFKHFENLKVNNVISNDGNTHKPLSELLYKSFPNEIRDKSKLEEYNGEGVFTRMQENRSKWTSYFNEKQFSGTFVEQLNERTLLILKSFPDKGYWVRETKNAKWYYSLTQLGESIIKSIKQA